MAQCAAHDGSLPCWALPNQQCFAQGEGWIFQVSSERKNWKRDLKNHESLHSQHWGQREALRKQALQLTRGEDEQLKVVWTCRQCAETLDALGKAVHHICKTATAPALKRLLKPGSSMPKRRKRRRTSAVDMSAVQVNLPSDLEHLKLSEQFAAQRKKIEELTHLSPASTFLLQRALACKPLQRRSLQVGDCFLWPGSKTVIGCVWAIKKGKVHAIEFQRKPKAGKSTRH